MLYLVAKCRPRESAAVVYSYGARKQPNKAFAPAKALCVGWEDPDLR